MNRLLAVGFRRVGQWNLVENALAYELDEHGRLRNILYSFVTGDQVRYIGKTVQALSTRLIGYRTPGKGQTTNQRNHANILRLLNDGQAVEILALPDSGLLHYGQFHLNLAAALEDSLIAIIDPDWNGGRRARESEETPEKRPVSAAPGANFFVQIGATYFDEGFFNVPVEFSARFGEHGQTIELFCGGDSEPLLGTINRNASANGTPRIYGRRPLREWFERNGLFGKQLCVDVVSPRSANLTIGNR